MTLPDESKIRDLVTETFGSWMVPHLCPTSELSPASAEAPIRQLNVTLSARTYVPLSDAELDAIEESGLFTVAPGKNNTPASVLLNGALAFASGIAVAHCARPAAVTTRLRRSARAREWTSLSDFANANPDVFDGVRRAQFLVLANWEIERWRALGWIERTPEEKENSAKRSGRGRRIRRG